MSDEPVKVGIDADENPVLEVAEHLGGDVKMHPFHGIGAMALTLSLKYHDMQMIPDGATYQQYKLEGRNMKTLNLNEVFETAIKMEVHLINSEKRIGTYVAGLLAEGLGAELDAEAQAEADRLAEAEGSQFVAEGTEGGEQEQHREGE